MSSFTPPQRSILVWLQIIFVCSLKQELGELKNRFQEAKLAAKPETVIWMERYRFLNFLNCLHDTIKESRHIPFCPPTRFYAQLYRAFCRPRIVLHLFSKSFHLWFAIMSFCLALLSQINIESLLIFFQNDISFCLEGHAKVMHDCLEKLSVVKV